MKRPKSPKNVLYKNTFLSPKNKLSDSPHFYRIQLLLMRKQNLKERDALLNESLQKVNGTLYTKGT